MEHKYSLLNSYRFRDWIHCTSCTLVHPRNILKSAELANWDPGQGWLHLVVFSTAFRLLVPFVVSGYKVEQAGLRWDQTPWPSLPCWRKSTVQQGKNRLALNIGLIPQVIGLHPGEDSSTKQFEKRFFIKSLLIIEYSCTYRPNSSESPKIPWHIFFRQSFFWAPSLR